MPKLWYENILKFGVILSLFSFFIIDKSLYFPYITGKQIYFNILIEILAVFCLALVVKYPEARPKKSYITWSLLAFFASLLVSSFFSIDFNLSFWGDAERMLGWFPTVHLLALYFIIITSFKKKEDWTWLFVSSLAAASALSLYAIFTAQGGKSVGNVNMTSNISTLGNATYVAGVMIFNFFFGWYLFFQAKSKPLKFVVSVGILLSLIAFFYADVSGSQVGLVLGLMTTLVIAGALNKEAKMRRWTWFGLGAMILLVVLLFSFRSASVFDGNKLGKILRDFNQNNTTLRTRTYAWRAAYLGFREHPIFGNGYGNFASHFDKYFIGSYYNWSLGEEYFDRAHNNILDILSTAGLVTLLAYLSIFVALAYYLIKSYREGKISVLEISTMTGVFVGYFIHNLAVFDALANYILLFFSLGFVYYLSNRAEDGLMHRIGEKLQTDRGEWTDKELGTLLGAAVIALTLIYNYNVQVSQVLEKSVIAASYWHTSRDPQLAVNMYKEAFAIKTPYDRDPRMLLANNINDNPEKLQSLPLAKRKEAVDYAISLLRQNLELNPHDSLTLFVLARLQTAAFRVTAEPEYLRAALLSLDASIAEGGEHIPPYILKSNLLVVMGDKDKAKATLNKARSFFDYPDLSCRLAALGFDQAKVAEETYQLADKCLAGPSGQESLGAGPFLDKLAARYRSSKKWDLLVKVDELKLSQDMTNKAMWQEIINLYRLLGQEDKAEAVTDAMNQVLKAK